MRYRLCDELHPEFRFACTAEAIALAQIRRASHIVIPDYGGSPCRSVLKERQALCDFYSEC